ncbi:MAG: hypothetical protein ABI083_05505 [Lapillicoccus sp.]
MQRLKKILMWVVVIFIIYAIVKSPTQAAIIVRTSFDIIGQGFTSIFAFFDALLGNR